MVLLSSYNKYKVWIARELLKTRRCAGVEQRHYTAAREANVHVVMGLTENQILLEPYIIVNCLSIMRVKLLGSTIS